jgi:protein-arginine kinase activator protein McsA
LNKLLKKTIPTLKEKKQIEFLTSSECENCHKRYKKQSRTQRYCSPNCKKERRIKFMEIGKQKMIEIEKKE